MQTDVPKLKEMYERIKIAERERLNYQDNFNNKFNILTLAMNIYFYIFY